MHGAGPVLGESMARTWADVVENAIRLALVILVLVLNTSFVGIARTFLDLGNPRTAIGVTLMTLALIGIVVVARMWDRRAAGTWVVAVAAASGLALAVPTTKVSSQLADT